MNFTIFGVTETEITGPGFTSLTLFGASELRRPTLAERIMQRRARGGQRPGLRERLFGRYRPLAITVFGVTSVVAPTLVEEYTAVRRIVESGSLSREECRTLIEGLSDPGPEDEMARLTVFGVCGLETASEKKQRKALEAAERAGVISARTRDELSQAIGCPNRAAAAIIGRAAIA